MITREQKDAALAAWQSLDDDVRDAIAAVVHVGVIVDSDEKPPVIFTIHEGRYVIVSAWDPGRQRLAFSSLFGATGAKGRFGNPLDPEKPLPEGFPEGLGLPAWIVPNDAREGLRQLKALGWTVAFASDLKALKAGVKAARDSAPQTLARLRAPGSSSREGAEKAPAKAPSKADAKALASEFDAL